MARLGRERYDRGMKTKSRVRAGGSNLNHNSKKGGGKKKKKTAKR